MFAIMRINMHQGTQEIGGTSVEIEFQWNGLILDSGILDLSTSNRFLIHTSGGCAAAIRHEWVMCGVSISVEGR
jgi:hypothetical protein